MTLGNAMPQEKGNCKGGRGELFYTPDLLFSVATPPHVHYPSPPPFHGQGQGRKRDLSG